MRIVRTASKILLPMLLPCTLSAQVTSLQDIFTKAESAYPSSSAPALFGPGSAAAEYSAEVEDKTWAPAMEARILEEIERERNEGLVVRRTDVECRSTTCAVLLVHATNNGTDGSIQDLAESFRERLGFVGVSRSDKLIPIQFVVETDPGQTVTTTSFVSGYVEIVLVRGPDSNLQASDNTRAR
jgi:hypothetical protein